MYLSHPSLWVGVVILVLLCGGVASQNWAVQAKFKTSVNLTCTDHRVNMTEISRAVRLRWILPTGNVLEKGMETTRLALHGKGEILQIMEVEEEDFGIYYCLLSHSSHEDNRVIKKGVNINGPYWGDLMEVYRINIIVGCIAAAVVAVIMLGCCFLYDRNVKQDVYIDDETFELALHSNKHKKDEGHVNSAMTSDEFKSSNVSRNDVNDVSSDDVKLEKEKGNGAPPDYDYEPTTHL